MNRASLRYCRDGAALARVAQRLLPLVGCLIASAVSMAAPTTIYVATNGRDTWSGNLSSPNANQTDGPKATLDGARLRIKLLKQQGQLSAEGAQVLVLPGTYRIASSLTFNAADAGTASGQIVYKSVSPRGAVLDGGMPVSGWVRLRDRTVLRRLPVSAQRRALAANLASQGISNYGSMKTRGAWMTMVTAPMELVVNDAPAQLASWPQAGWATISAATGTRTFRSDSARPRVWKTLNDTWVQGFFGNNWSDFTIPLSSYSRTSGDVTMAAVPNYGIVPGLKYRLLNALEELDRPGEYYVDRTAGKIYYWPIDPITSVTTEVTMLDGPVLNCLGTSNLRFEGFEIRNGRGHGIYSWSSNNVDVVNCGFSNLGNRAVNLQGSDCLVQANDVKNVGYGVIYMKGGDRATLISSNNQVLNNQIHDVGRLVKTAESGIEVEGVGFHVANNAIYNVPAYGVLFRGNDIVIERNEIFNACFDTGDTGAISTGRDMTNQGNIVRDNLIRDCLTKQSSAAWNRVNAIYLDDFTSGVTVTGNVVVNCSNGILLGGGNDNRVQNNLFLNCPESMVVDARGLTWATFMVLPGGAVYDRLHAFNLLAPPWTKYPNLAGYWNEDLRTPKRNSLQINLYVDSGGITVADQYFMNSPNTVASNVSDTSAALRDPGNYDFAVVGGSNASTIPFAAVDASTMGMVLDSYRLSLPNLRGN